MVVKRDGDHLGRSGKKWTSIESRNKDTSYLKQNEERLTEFLHLI